METKTVSAWMRASMCVCQEAGKVFILLNKKIPIQASEEFKIFKYSKQKQLFMKYL